MRPEDFESQKHGQDWASSDADVRSVVRGVTGIFDVLLAENHIASILHGSLATGAFCRPKSDIDLLIVCGRALTDGERSVLWSGLLRLSDNRPILGDIELSVIRSDVAIAPRHPVPYELRFSEDLKDRIRAGTIRHPDQARDEDLAAHLTVARNRGLSIAGLSPQAALGAVPWQDYLASIQADFDWIVDGEHLAESPFYGILNICRVLWVQQAGEGCVPDKEESALWALQTLPERYHALIRQALQVYQSKAPLPEQTADARRQGGASWSQEALLTFRDFARACSGRY